MKKLNICKNYQNKKIKKKKVKNHFFRLIIKKQKLNKIYNFIQIQKNMNLMINKNFKFF